MEKTNREKIGKLVGMAVLLAILIVLQLIGNFIHIGPTSISLVLIPIALGAMLFGPIYGGFLGLVFGIIVLIGGITGTDAFTNILLNENPVGTVIICIAKSTVAGVVAGLVFKLISKFNSLVASFVAAALVPIINTGLFILGGLTLVGPTLTSHFVAEGTTLLYFLVIGCAGLNFIAEFAVNLIFAPALNRLCLLIKDKQIR
ncbi:MAG: ECF transporter S component [Clostridiales bacterium]|nr:ECF transporter S component [Clostridiales bacterium]